MRHIISWKHNNLERQEIIGQTNAALRETLVSRAYQSWHLKGWEDYGDC